jgi:phage terminase large subunit-like protein
MLHSGMKYEEARERDAPFDRIVDDDPIGRGAIASAVVEGLARGRSLFVIANNKAEGSSPHTIFRLAAGILEGLG